mmetsp:Transcript_27556/g.88592  ORF Transcript_27556/g.88592 Transcript_27556/m.88592 type:complete len:100 (-) Transcript_27556:498-797(-)
MNAPDGVAGRQVVMKWVQQWRRCDGPCTGRAPSVKRRLLLHALSERGHQEGAIATNCTRGAGTDANTIGIRDEIDIRAVEKEQSGLRTAAVTAFIAQAR